MNRFYLLVAALFQALAVTSAFAPMSTSASIRQYSRLFVEDTEAEASPTNFQERGVSVDQDGKSNVWAIEPKMEVSTKSSEEKTQSALVAGGGIAAFVVLAGIILTNLPDPNQF